MAATPIIRTGDGSEVKPGDTWKTGDTHDWPAGKLVERVKNVELIATTVPDVGSGRIGKATVCIGGTITRIEMTVRSDHPSYPGRRVAFLEV